MLDKSHEPPHLQVESTGAAPMPEWKIVEPIARNWPWLLATAVLFSGGVLSQAALHPAPHPARAELLVRVGYEYTPAPADPTRDYPQVTVRLDEAIGTELQLLTSPPLVQRVLAELPYPVERGDKPPATQDIADRLQVKRVEGSTIITLEMIDDDSGWARDFLGRLIAAYREQRAQLYAQTPYVALLAEQRAAVTKAVAADRAAAAELSQTITDALLRWSEGLSLLAEDPLRQADFRSLSAEFAAFQFRLAGRPGSAGVAALLSQYATPRVIGPGQNGSSDMAHLRGQLARIGEATERLVVLNEREAGLNDRLRALDDALLRQKVRELGSANVEVMTAPYVADRPAGLSTGMKTGLAAVIGLVLAAVVAVIASGLQSARKQGA